MNPPPRALTWIVFAGGIALLGLSACGDDAKSADAALAVSELDATQAITLSDFADGAWVLHVDRALKPGGPKVSLSTDPLTEQDYEPSTKKPTYAVAVSQQASRVSVGDTPWLGERMAADATRISFDLTQGAFAGGRFVVWQARHGLQAELTLYGSGVPIVQSERGELVRSE